MRFFEFTKNKNTLYNIHDFLRSECTDHAGRTINDILSKDDKWLEERHDYIQLLFPIDQTSSYFRAAPVISPEEALELATDEKVVKNLERAYYRMLDFYSNPRNKWFRKHNHNFLRISRILRCLRMFGLNERADEFYIFLEQKVQLNPGIVGETTLSFWKENNAVVYESVLES